MENKTAAAPESAGAASPATVKVYVVQRAVKEKGRVYLKNQVLEVTPERAAALGEMVAPYADPAQQAALATTPAKPAAPAPAPVAPAQAANKDKQ
jgi:hypothetical protein